jgi:multiple sugar transport system substrate-binding protein
MAGTGEGVSAPRSRRDFLRLAAGAAAVAATGAACGSGSDKPKRNAAKAKGSAAKGDRTLRIAQFSHFVHEYDLWFDEDYTQRWGERNDVQVIVGHIPNAEDPERAAAEVAAGQGHDLFHLITAAARFEDDVIDLQDIVEEVESKAGRMLPLVDRATFNPRTKKRFGFPDNFIAGPVHYRTDLWAPIGTTPDTWEDVLRAAPTLKAGGHPLGLSLSGDFDGNAGLLSLMHAFGASVQDEAGNVAISRPATVEAVKMGVAIFTAGMTEEVLGWDSSASSNNRYLAAGKASMIVNAVSAQRAIESQDPALAERIALLPPPAGPAGRNGVYGTGVYVIWKFARNQEVAKRFLVDLALDYREAFLRSAFFNLPPFPGTVPDLPQLVVRDDRAKPPEKYAVLAQAGEWSTNIGYPGYANAPMEEVFNQYLLPKMFAAAARGEMSAEEAVKAAEAQITPIFDKWRERRKI